MMNPDFFRLQKNFTQPHESKRNLPYKDSLGNWTIGIGWNFFTNPMRDEAILAQFMGDINWSYSELKKNAWFNKLDENRQIAIVDMVFNIGMKGFLEFTDLITALTFGNHKDAHDAVLDSLYAKQVKERANEIANVLLTGQLPSGVY